MNVTFKPADGTKSPPGRYKVKIVRIEPQPNGDTVAYFKVLESKPSSSPR